MTKPLINSINQLQDQHLSDLFMVVWHSLPVRARRRIYATPLAAVFESTDTGSNVAQAALQIDFDLGLFNYEIHFNPNDMQRMTDDEAKATIAHELAHICLRHPGNGEDPLDKENEADELAEDWGYDSIGFMSLFISELHEEELTDN